MAQRRSISRIFGKVLLLGLLLGFVFLIIWVSQKLLAHPLAGSSIIGLISAITVFGVLINMQSKRIQKANLLAKQSLYQDYSPYEFEHLTAEIFRQLGYQVTVTGSAGDEGIDVLLEKDGVYTGVQCKRYRNTIGPALIREFVGALDGAGLEKGFFVTTSEFTQAAINAAQKSSLEITLVSGKDLAALRSRVEKHINTDIIPKPWWGTLSKFQKALSAVLFFIWITVIMGGVSYLILISII